MLLAAAATAFISCDKQNAEATQSPEESVLVFTSEKPSFDDVVKTEWNESEKTVYWSEGDKIRMAYTINGVWQGGRGSMEVGEDAKLYESVTLKSSTAVASFSVPIAGTKFNEVTEEILETGAHVFYSIYPAECSEVNFDSEGVAKITVSSEQAPSDATFDASSDVMIGKSVGDFDCIQKDVEIPLKWNRLVAHAKITLKALNDAVEGETVNSIVLTAQDGANMTGTYTVDLQTGAVSPKSASNVLTIAGTKLSAVDASKNVSFWTCMMPCTWTSLKVVVETDKATYTRDIDLSSNQKTFLQNRRNLLTINMADAVRTPKAETNYNGDWLITAIDTDSKIYAASAYTSGNNLPAVEVSISDGVVSSLSDLSSCKMTFNKVASGEYVGLYTIKDASGNYLYAAGATSNNYLKASSTLTENSYWDVKLESDGTYSIKATKGSATSKDLRFYRSKNYFTCYNGTQTVVTIYPYPTL